jgi:hypothetical protein
MVSFAFPPAQLSSTLERNVLAHCVTKIINRFAEHYQATQNSHHAFKMTIDEFLLPQQTQAEVTTAEVTGRITVPQAPSPVAQQPVRRSSQAVSAPSLDSVAAQLPPLFPLQSEGSGGT